MVSLATLLQRANALTYQLPVANSLHHLQRASEEPALALEVEEFANGTAPIMDGAVSQLLSDFLEVKCKSGSAQEQKFYAGMIPAQLVTRLLSKRPLAFLNDYDSFLLTDGRSGASGFEAIGKDEEVNLLLPDLISYDEIAIAALLGVAVPTHFFNVGPVAEQHGMAYFVEQVALRSALLGGRAVQRGARRARRHLPGVGRVRYGTPKPERAPRPCARACAAAAHAGDWRGEAPALCCRYTGLVGARFEKPGCMEYLPRSFRTRALPAAAAAAAAAGC